MDDRRLGIGIVGLGGIGLMHARALGEIADDVRLVAYSGERTADAGDAGWPDAAALAPEEVIGHPEVDVVAICTPSATHADLTLASLAAGRHVVVEKPLAVRVDDAVRIAESARERGLVVSVISQRRFEAEHQYLRRVLDEGLLGEIRLAAAHVHWHRDDEYYASVPWRKSMSGGGGSLMNQGVHSVDLLRWFCGPVESVTAHYGTLAHDIEAEDTAVATVQFASGALGLISTTTATPPGSPATIALHGSRGSVELGQGTVLRWDVPGAPAPAAADHIPSGAADPLAIGVAGHVNQWRQVVSSIRASSPVPIGADEGVETVRLLCAIYEAAASGRRVRPADLG